GTAFYGAAAPSWSTPFPDRTPFRPGREPEHDPGRQIERDRVQRGRDELAAAGLGASLAQRGAHALGACDERGGQEARGELLGQEDRKSTRLNSSHVKTSYAVCRLTR